MSPNDFRPKLIKGTRVASAEYRSWQMMKNRCHNPRAQDYRHYGGRGIAIEDRWMEFDNFLHDIGPRPTIDHTLERKNVDRGYSKHNCYWATRQVQARNRRFIKRYHGLTSWEWAEKLHIKLASFHLRLWKFKTGRITETQLYLENRRAKK